MLPNVFDDTPGTPGADITFVVNDAEQTARWTADGGLDELEALAAVSVYDSHATSIYIDKDNELAYRPFGLDLYDRLVDVCNSVKAEIGRRIDEHASAKPNLDELIGEHDVGQLIGQLNAETRQDDVEALAVWTDQDAEALRLAREGLAQLRQASPAEVAQTKRAQSARARQLAGRLQTIANELSEQKLRLYGELRANAAGAREAADLAARQIFEDAPLAEVGSDAWRRMWDAARAYSVEHAYPKVDFPATHDEARCVLCQQPLEPAAAQLLQSFDKFVTGRLATEAEQIDADRNAAQEVIESLDLTASDPQLLEVEQAGGPTADEIRTALARADARARAVLGEWDNLDELPNLVGLDLAARLAELADGLDAEANDLDSADSDIALATARQAVDGLEAREKLAARHQDALNAIDWHKAHAALDAARASISTNAITQRSRQVTEQVVSQDLLDAFAARLTTLGGGSLPVRLKPQGRAGQVRHRLELEGSPVGAPPGKVLSEGERSVVALAAFFAEVDFAPTPSPIVLDDPVTSLDHGYRERVVHHIYEQAQLRQVIVFTHDQVFVSELLDTFKNNDQGQLVAHHVVGRTADTGLVSEGPPWQLAKVNARLGQLRDRCAEARRLWKDNDLAAYEGHAKHTLVLLREAWERAVEEVVLNGTVQRFSRQVRTLQLPKVAQLTGEDVAAVEAGMAFASAQVHDQANAAGQPIPNPDELEAQVATLAEFCKEYRNR